MKRSQRIDLDHAQGQVAHTIARSAGGERLMKVLSREVGPRPSGSPAMKRASDILAREWSQLGAINVHTEAVPVLAWDESASRLELVAPDSRIYDSLQCIHSASTAVEGKLVYAGSGTAEELERLGDSVRGSIVLAKGHEISGGKYEPVHTRIWRMQDTGVVGVILASQNVDLPATEFLYAHRQISVPVVGVSGNDGAELAQMARRDQTHVRIHTAGKPRETTCVSLIGELGPAGGEPLEVIIFSAHLDSLYVSPGAFDNLTGVITLTEAARALAPFQRHFTRKLRLIAFTGEEYGFSGSKHYVRAHADELDRIRFVLNLDGLYDSTAKGISVVNAPEMHDYIERALAQQHPEVVVRSRLCMSSDYLPFVLKGIPAALQSTWEEWYPPHSHTREDTDEKIPVAWLRSNAVVFAHLLLLMLTEPERLPAKRKSRGQVLEYLRQEDAEELVLDWLDFPDS